MLVSRAVYITKFEGPRCLNILRVRESDSMNNKGAHAPMCKGFSYQDKDRIGSVKFLVIQFMFD